MGSPRHVVMLASDFRPMTGGIAESLHHLAHHLVRHVPVTVMTTVPQNGYDWEHAYCLVRLPPLAERRLGERIGDNVAPIRKLHTGAYFLALGRQAGRLARRITGVGDGVVVVVGSWETASHFWCKACREAGIPYSIVAHGTELLIPLYATLPEWRREDFARAEHVLANSEATGRLAIDRFGLEKPPVVTNVPVGSRPSSTAIAERAATLRQALNLPEGPVVLSLGRLVRRKGFDLVLRAVADLAAEFRTLSYVVAGNGPERMALETRARELEIADRVRMLGEVDDLTKWALYEMCDVFAMPNRLLDGADWEGFGIVFLEAALSRRPSIAGRTGGTADAVVDGVTGLLIDPEHRTDLTNALRRLLADDGLRCRFGQAGEEIARTRFSGEAVADRLWSALR